jgi:hypothetical protein
VLQWGRGVKNYLKLRDVIYAYRDSKKILPNKQNFFIMEKFGFFGYPKILNIILVFVSLEQS